MFLIVFQVLCDTYLLPGYTDKGTWSWLSWLLFGSEVLMQFTIVTSPSNKMKPIQIAIILSGLSQAYPRYSYVPIHSDQCECKGYNKNSRSIIVKDTM